MLRLNALAGAMVLLATTLGSPSGTALAEEGPSPAELAMQAFLRDQLPPEELRASAATMCIAGMAGPYPCDNVDLLAFVPLADLGGGSGNDVWGWTGCGGREFALMGRSSGTSFVEITDPENPVYLGNLPTHTSNSSWRDIKTYDDHAFIVSEASSHGMQVFDLSQLCSVATPPVTFSNTAHYSGFGSAHNIVINEGSGFAYAVGTGTCSGGLHMVDIGLPTSPTSAGCFSADGYTHDAQCVIYAGADPQYLGQEICFNSNEDTLTVVDVTNKTNPVQVSRTGYAGSGYTHQGWLTEDHLYFLLDDELDESNFGHNTRTRMWDVSDLDNPVLIGFHDSPTPAIDHNLYVKGQYVFQANYRAGLRILDLTDIAAGNLVEWGYFDIYPPSDSASFNGAWSVYPFFDSGVVVVSGIEQGLFVLAPGLTGFTLAVSPTSGAVCAPADGTFAVDIGSVLGFSDPVALAASGNPAGTSVGFSVNPVTPPGSSTMTISGTGGATAGSYTIQVDGTSTTGTTSRDVGFGLFTLPPGAVTLIAPANGSINQPARPTFEWSAAVQGGSYRLEAATDAAFTNVVLDETGIVGTTFEPASDLPTNTQLWWRVTPANACGDGTTSAVFTFITEALPGDCGVGSTPSVEFVDDLETGAPGWVLGSGGSGNTWALSTARAYSGTTSYYAVDVSTVSDQRLDSPAVVLPVGSSPLTLQFWNWQLMEDRSGGCWDGGEVEISTDDGSSWTPLPDAVMLTDPYDGPVTGLGGLDGWCDDLGAPGTVWKKAVVDIDAYAGQTVRFRFRIGTDSSVSREGWYIDDVTVQSCVASEPPMFADGFEDGTTDAWDVTH